MGDNNNTQIGGNVGINNSGNSESDAQLKLIGVLKTNGRTDMIVFSFTLLLIEVTAIVVIPAEGTQQAPVYLKFKILRNNPNG